MEKKGGRKKNKMTSLIVKRDLKEQGKCLSDGYEVKERKYNDRNVEGFGGWIQSAIEETWRLYLRTVRV